MHADVACPKTARYACSYDPTQPPSPLPLPLWVPSHKAQAVISRSGFFVPKPRPQLCLGQDRRKAGKQP